jgi:hypothetical protein
MFWGSSGPSAEEKKKAEEQKQAEQQAADNAFTSPSHLASRLATRSPRSFDGGSASSGIGLSPSKIGRSPSLISDPGNAKVFDDIAGATGVIIRTPHAGTATNDATLAPPNLDHPSNPGASSQHTATFNPNNVSSALNMADAALAYAAEVVSETTKLSLPIHDAIPSEISTVLDKDSKKESGAPNNSLLPPWAHSNHGATPTPINLIATTSQTNNAASMPGTPRSRDLDLKHNDNSFGVFANLIVDRFEDKLNSGVSSFALSTGDRDYLDRTVQPRVRQALVDAVQYRLETCPPDSQHYVHVVLRKCQALGLDKDGDENILFASAFTTIVIHVSLCRPETRVGCVV